MPIEILERERRLPLDELLVEGIESGLVEDLKYRPNKYFHPIEDVRLEKRKCIIQYKGSINPVNDSVTMEQVKQLLAGTIDAIQRRAHEQVFYLYPGVEAFGLNRRQLLRIVLTNARPQKDRERSEQELSVDAFTSLIAEHCEAAHKKVIRYNKPILTLRHLQNILDKKPPSVLAWGTVFVLFFATLVFFALHQWGPPHIKKSLQEITHRFVNVGRQMTRSGSDEWFDKIGKERQKHEYKFAPVPLTLMIHPNTKTTVEKQKLYQTLTQLLITEFPKVQYQLIIPHPSLAPKFYQRWLNLCKYSIYSKNCQKGGWLLIIKNYKGGLRPLLSAIRELNRKSTNNQQIKTTFLGFISSMEIGFKTIKKPLKPLKKSSPILSPKKRIKPLKIPKEEPSPFAPSKENKKTLLLPPSKKVIQKPPK